MTLAAFYGLPVASKKMAYPGEIEDSIVSLVRILMELLGSNVSNLELIGIKLRLFVLSIEIPNTD
jgi:hypothetical protein